MQIISERTLRRIDRAVENGKIIPFLALATLAIALIAGIGANFLSPAGFDSLGDALWWSVQTVTTVGYGDVVPESNGGRLIGIFVMIFGEASVSLITALVTSSIEAAASSSARSTRRRRRRERRQRTTVVPRSRTFAARSRKA